MPKSKKAAATTVKPLVRQLTVKQAVEWLTKGKAPAGRDFRRVIAAVRDPNNDHAYATIVWHE